MWLYNGTRRSVLIVALFHSAYNDIRSEYKTLRGTGLPGTGVRGG
jgi:hypothetical protein